MLSTSRTCPVCGRHFAGDVDRCLDDGVLLAGGNPLIGKHIDGKYEILSFVGMGGMSEVYRARHVELGRILAIKFLKSSYPLDLQRFRREAISISQLEHSHIAKVYAFTISADGRPYMVMEYLEGHDLADILQTEQPLSVGRTLHIVDQIAAGLAHAHACGVIHRDIKPSNIVLVDEASNAETVKIVDFGTARIIRDEANQKLTLDGEVFGTREFISPEQFEGAAADARADIYALGMLAYQCVVYDGRVPEAIQPLIKKTLAIDPQKRYQSADELREAIAAIKESNADQTRYVRVESNWTQTHRTNWHLLVLVIGVLFMGLVALLFWRQIALDKAKSELIKSNLGNTRKTLGLGRPAVMEQAESFIKQGLTADAENISREWIARARAEKRATAEDEAEIAFVIGHARMTVGDFETAESHWRQAIKYYESDKSRQEHLGIARNYLANTLICLNKLSEAEELVRKNIEASESAGRALSETAEAYAIMARIAKRTGRPELSNQNMHKAIAAAEQRFPADATFVHEELAQHYLEAGRTDKATVHLRTALKGNERRQGEMSTETVKTRLLLAEVLINAKKFDEAEELLTKNIECCRLSNNLMGEAESEAKLEQLKKLEDEFD